MKFPSSITPTETQPCQIINKLKDWNIQILPNILMQREKSSNMHLWTQQHPVSTSIVTPSLKKIRNRAVPATSIQLIQKSKINWRTNNISKGWSTVLTYQTWHQRKNIIWFVIGEYSNVFATGDNDAGNVQTHLTKANLEDGIPVQVTYSAEPTNLFKRIEKLCGSLA